jgi:hypothetical protein
MTIKVFKLINGEEVISEVTSTSEAGYFLENPASIQLQQTAQGVGVGIAPYMPYAKDKIYLYKHAIASESSADDKMENEYRRVFGSGIQVVSAGSIKM